MRHDRRVPVGLLTIPLCEKFQNKYFGECRDPLV